MSINLYTADAPAIPRDWARASRYELIESTRFDATGIVVFALCVGFLFGIGAGMIAVHRVCGVVL